MAEPLSPREAVLLRIQQLEEELRTMREVLAMMDAREQKPVPLTVIRSFDFRGMKAIQAMVEYLKTKGSEAGLDELFEALHRSGYEFNPKSSLERQRRSLIIAASMNPERVKYDEDRHMFSLVKK